MSDVGGGVGRWGREVGEGGWEVSDVGEGGWEVSDVGGECREVGVGRWGGYSEIILMCVFCIERIWNRHWLISL